MVRKFAFHMILAGHRYSKAGQVSLADHKINSHNLIDLFQCFLNVLLYITASLCLWGRNKATHGLQGKVHPSPYSGMSLV